jgi:tetrahydromethanopterin S-methyltransferase subunit F
MQPSLMSSSSKSRRVISSYKQYAEAQKAVDYLSDEKFEVSRIAIIAEELRYVEQVTGRLDSGRAALQGLGSLIGLVVGFLSTTPTLELVIRGAFVGLLFGLSSSLITYWMTGGQRDFSSFSSMQAGRFDVVADDEVADKAAQMLERMR